MILKSFVRLVVVTHIAVLLFLGGMTMAEGVSDIRKYDLTPDVLCETTAVVEAPTMDDQRIYGLEDGVFLVFSVDGTEHRILHDAYELVQYPVGSSVRVTYVDGNPQQNWVDTDPFMHRDTGFRFLSVGYGLAGIYALFELAFWMYRKNKGKPKQCVTMATTAV